MMTAPRREIKQKNEDRENKVFDRFGEFALTAMILGFRSGHDILHDLTVNVR
jgi:hypothetical protein